MSLYNLIFGTNPFSSTLLQMLGVTEDDVPRYRDCFLNEDGSEIIIHTRTGGGNRDYYESLESWRECNSHSTNEEDWPEGPWNDDLRKIAGFKGDDDDEFDCTYADFRYEVPELFREQVALLKNLGAVQNPAERWQTVLDGLRSRTDTSPEVQRAIAVGEAIMGKIATSFAKSGDE